MAAVADAAQGPLQPPKIVGHIAGGHGLPTSKCHNEKTEAIIDTINTLFQLSATLTLHSISRNL